MNYLTVVTTLQGHEKKLNSSLSFGQAALIFFLPRATSCSSQLMILLQDGLPGLLLIG